MPETKVIQLHCKTILSKIILRLTAEASKAEKEGNTQRARIFRKRAINVLKRKLEADGRRRK